MLAYMSEHKAGTESEPDSDEIEITPEMIEAGVSALLDMDESVSREHDVVWNIFRAMIAARANAPENR